MTDYSAFFINQQAADPTRTLTLRSKWSADWSRRVNALKKAVLKSVVDQDCFGLNQPDNRVFVQAELPPSQPRQFAYRWSHEKIEAFMEWLRQMEERGLLEITLRDTLRPGGEPWSNIYVRSAYQRGLAYALDNVRRNSAELGALLGMVESDLPPTFRNTGELVSMLMNQPFHADRLGLMYTRVFDELKGVTRDMDNRISQVLTRGMAEGKNPRELGKMLSDGIPDLHIGSPFRKAEVRGQLIARTEVIHVHAQAALNEYEAIENAHGEVILVEWVATKDSRTRPAHARLVDPHRGYDGLVMTREEAYGRIGEPNCLLGDAMVYSPSLIERAFERFYDGPIITIHTAGGNVLSCTPNHPILTPAGLIPASALNVGGKVLCSPMADVSVPICEDKDKVIASIKDIARSLFLSGEISLVRNVGHHFHGDGAGSEVTVIGSNVELGNGFYTDALKHIGEFGFSTVGMKHPFSSGFGSLLKSFHGVSGSPSGNIGSGYLGSSKSFPHPGPFESFCFGLVSGLYPGSGEPDVYRPSPISEPFGERVYRFTGQESLDDIVSIDVGSFHGSVFNLQTGSGFYYATNNNISYNCRCVKGIITGNCRCAQAPYIPVIQGMPRKVTDKAKAIIDKVLERERAYQEAA